MFDFRHYINLINEAQYDSLADAIRRQFSDQLDLINSNIQWSKTALKKADRITWYLKILRLYLEDNLTPEVLGDYQFSTLEQLQNDLVHYYGFNDAAIEAYQYRNQSIGDLIRDLQQLEKKWREKQNQERGVNPQSGDYVLFEFADGIKWWWINRAYCPEEGRSGRHCGNVVGQHKTDQRILSLRNARNQVILTFILEPDGTLGEMKAKSNQKPQEKFHPHIIKLLLWDKITGISGMGYLPDMNFSVFDLNEEYLNYLDQHKPKLIIDQIQITPFDILNTPNAIKQKYREVAVKQEPLISNVLFDSSLENWTNLINQKKKLLVYLPIEYYDSSPNFKDQLLKGFLSFDIPLRLLLKCPVKIRKDPIFLEKLVRGYSSAIQFIVPPVKNYENLCKIAVTDDIDDSSNNLNLCYIPENYRTRELCELSINTSLGSLICFPKDSPIAIKYLKSFLDEFEADEDTFYRKLLRIIPENQQTFDVYKMLIKSGGSWALMHIPEEKRTLELCKLAMRFDSDSIKYIPDHLKHHFDNKT